MPQAGDEGRRVDLAPHLLLIEPHHVGAIGPVGLVHISQGKCATRVCRHRQRSDTLVAGLDFVALEAVDEFHQVLVSELFEPLALAGKVDIGVQGAVSEAGIQEAAVAPRCTVPDLRRLDQDDIEVRSALFGLQTHPTAR